MKLTNKLSGFNVEAEKLKKDLYDLEKEKDKYAGDATLENSKYYTALEQVKMKINLINRLQKKNIEAEARLKQQNNLYEVVRSDKCLFAKNLLEATVEIGDLKYKFKIMTNQISKLKEEIAQKDAEKAEEDQKKSELAKKNQAFKKSIDQVTSQCESSDRLIKGQEADIARLKYVISEAEQEK